MSETKALKKIFSKHLDKDEWIIFGEKRWGWKLKYNRDHYYEANPILPPTKILIYILVGIGLYLINLTLFIIYSLFFIIIVLDYLGEKAPINKIKNTSVESNLAKAYIFTNKKVCIINHENNITTTPYNKIYHILLGHNNIAYIFDSPFLKSSILQIEPNINIGKLRKKFIELWGPNSPYKSFNNILQLYSDSKNFIYKKYEFRKHEKAEISGFFHGMNIKMEFLEINENPKLSIKITCKNEEENYLFIREEKNKDIFSKLIGLQDYKIGLKWFDDEYIIQSNYEKFISYILDDNGILTSIHKNIPLSQGSISMGIPAKMEKETKINIKENQSLDAHLLGTLDKKERTVGLNSELTYHFNDLSGVSDLDILANEIISAMDMMTELGKRVNGYNDQ